MALDSQAPKPTLESKVYSQCYTAAQERRALGRIPKRRAVHIMTNPARRAQTNCATSIRFRTAGYGMKSTLSSKFFIEVSYLPHPRLSGFCRLRLAAAARGAALFRFPSAGTVKHWAKVGYRNIPRRSSQRLVPKRVVLFRRGESAQIPQPPRAANQWGLYVCEAHDRSGRGAGGWDPLGYEGSILRRGGERFTLLASGRSRLP